MSAGDLRDQAVANGEQCVGVTCLGEGKTLLHGADHHAADDVDEHDQQAGDRVAAHELRGAVHRAEEGAFVLELPAAGAGLILVDQTGGQVGIDCHLLAGHRVQGEAGCDLGDAAGALRDHHEVHDHQDREHDDADHEVAAHHEVAECLDHVAGGVGAVVAVGEDQARGRKVQREAEHRRDQQNRGERGEFERRMNEQRRHQDQYREDDRARKQQIEQERRQRQDQHDEDREDADREREVAALQKGP